MTKGKYITPERLHEIAWKLQELDATQPGLNEIAMELEAFVVWQTDLEGAKKRKLEMVANMPESRAAMFNRTIQFNQNRAAAAEERVQQLEMVLRELGPMLNEPGKLIAEKALESGVVVKLVPLGTLPGASSDGQ